MHYLEIHYFLADDTIEIKEKMPPNSGTEAGPMFLKRMRIPRVSIVLKYIITFTTINKIELVLFCSVSFLL